KEHNLNGQRWSQLADLCKEMFWMQLRSDHKLMDKSKIGIRQYWMVVGNCHGNGIDPMKNEAEQVNPLMKLGDLLSRFGGGEGVYTMRNTGGSESDGE